MLVIGCGTRTADSPRDNTEDSITQDIKKIMTIALDKGSEDFNNFFKKFTTDSLFQIERVKFPWTMMTWELGEDAPIKELIDRVDWKYTSFYYEDNYATRQIDAYTQNIKNYGDTVKLEIRGVDNGIHTDYEFVKDNDKWFLVSGKDYSN